MRVFITQGEKYNKVVDAWAKCTDRVADEMMAQHLVGEGRREDQSREIADQLDLHDVAIRAHVVRRRR
jgi:hypothetical protein